MANGFAQLEKLILGLNELAEHGAARVSAELTPAIQGVLENQYAEGKGPSGETWAPLKATGRPSHLQKSGDMSAASKAVSGVKGITVRIPKPGGFHQSGTKNMVARKLVPDHDPLPGEWGSAVREVATAVIVETLKG